MSFTIGSLFDGSGGFPLAATMSGGIPKWASEIEPYPIAVTKSRFPNVKHLGSVTDIKGGEIDPVDVITFGSPCQDLSVAGKRAGLKHEANGDDETTRSGLFMEAVRIIKEMREATNGVYPRFALWENVPGAFSSNKGEDFRIVLEELIKIAEPSAVMPPVPAKGGWPYADSYTGDGWSLAYRVFDAQYWGVPQRRRRIYLVADFRGLCARKVLFEREGLRGYFETGRTPWQAAPGDAEGGAGAADCENVTADGVSPTLEARAGTGSNNQPIVAYGISSYHSNAMKSSNPHSGIYIENTARTLDAMNCGYPACNQGGIVVCESVYCLQANGIDRTDTAGCNGKGVTEDVSYTLNTIDRHAVAYQTYQETVGALCARDYKGVGSQYVCEDKVVVDNTPSRYITRRLTPTECARLQGFPDTWGHPIEKTDFTDEEYQFWLNVRNTHAAINDKATKEYTEDQILKWYNGLHTDSSEYKMWGNGIALPNALYVMQGVAEVMSEEKSSRRKWLMDLLGDCS